MKMDEFEAAIQSLWKNCNVIKHNWGLTPEQDKVLLTKLCNKVILLSRENFAKQAVSLVMARQVDVWNVATDPKSKRAVSEFHYQPLDLRELLARIEKFRYERNVARGVLQTHGIPTFEITYEDLFEVEPAKAMSLIQRLYAFLGYEAVLSQGHSEQVRWTLDPSNAKQNDFHTYMKVPNILTINTELSRRGLGDILQ